MPGAFARTATQALNNVTFPYLSLMADLGLREACQRRPELATGVNCDAGVLTSGPVAEAHRLPWAPFTI
jgi:alanine dehydrogenase